MVYIVIKINGCVCWAAKAGDCKSLTLKHRRFDSYRIHQYLTKAKEKLFNRRGDCIMQCKCSCRRVLRMGPAIVVKLIWAPMYQEGRGRFAPFLCGVWFPRGPPVLKFMEGCLAGDASHVLNTCGAARPGFRLRHPSAKFVVSNSELSEWSKVPVC